MTLECPECKSKTKFVNSEDIRTADDEHTPREYRRCGRCNKYWAIEGIIKNGKVIQDSFKVYEVKLDWKQCSAKIDLETVKKQKANRMAVRLSGDGIILI
jgi:transcriptional regulator NrdR family protein